MNTYLEDFYEAKGVFLEFRTDKRAKALAGEIESLVWTEIANLDQPLRQQAITAILIREQSKAAKIDMLRENVDFNFSKIHFLEHLPEHIKG